MDEEKDITKNDVAGQGTDPPDEPMNRRDLFGAAGLIAVGTLAGGAAGLVHKKIAQRPKHDPTSLALDKPWVPGADRFGVHEQHWTSSSCAQCPAGCGIRVRVVQGRAVGIEGNPENPLNRGGIGPRGLAGLQALYDPDRVMGPLLRENGKLVAIGWERARSILVERLAALRATGAPQQLLVMTGRERGFVHELLARFARTFGTPNFVDGSPSRSSVLCQAMEAAVGQHELPTFDWSAARLVLTLEAGFLENTCQSVYLARVAGRMRRGPDDRRAAIVHAGPTFDLAGYNADEWIHIRPGTGGALALGICHVLLRDGLYDRTFAAAAARGFEAFERFVKESFSPEQTAARTGTTKTRIEWIARHLAERRPSFAFVDERSLAYSNGLETAAAAIALNALLGSLGSMVYLEPHPPHAPWPEIVLDEVAKKGLTQPRLDRAGSPEFPRARSVHETLPDALGAASMVMLDHANPLWARAQPSRWRKALEAIPFVVSFSPFRDETVESVAHLVLPDHTYLERWEDAAAAPGVGVAVSGVCRPVVEPVHDTRATGDVLVEVARALGGPMVAAFPWPDFRGAMDARLRGLFESGRGTIVEPNERAFLARLFERGFWADPTPVRREIEAVQLLATWSDPRWIGDEGFPLQLIAYRPLGYAEGSGANLPWLRHVRSRSRTPSSATPIYFHPDDAPNLRAGDMVSVTSPFGTIVAEACPEPRTTRGCVAIPMNGGHEAFGRFAKGRGSNVRHLLSAEPAPRSGANLLGSTRVRLTRVGGPR